MKTVTVDIINEGAIKLLQDMELMQLIRLRTEKSNFDTGWNKSKLIRLKGMMAKQSNEEIDAQIKSFRDEWE